MIRLEIKGCCGDCPYIELELNELNTMNGCLYTVACIHEEVCHKLKIERDRNEARGFDYSVHG